MKRFFIMCVMATALVSSFAMPARAHESRNVGELNIVVGWADEPAVAGFLNAAQVRIRHEEGDHSEAVTGASLKVQVTFGGNPGESLTLEPAFGSPGEYRATVIPTRAGEYTFHITGRAHGARIDQKFTSGEDTFDSPATAADLQFPEPDLTNAELKALIDRTGGRVAKEADDASSQASLGTILGGAGLAVALIALVVALVRKPKARAA